MVVDRSAPASRLFAQFVPNPADTPVISFAVTSKTLPLMQVKDLADICMAQKLSQVPGVGRVSIAGGQRPAIRVLVNPRALAAYGLAIDDIRTDITNENTDLAKGAEPGSATKSRTAPGSNSRERTYTAPGRRCCRR
jgi:multidrug efflux pump